MFGFLTDTGAMAVLALTCVKRSMIKTQNKSGEDLQSISNYIESLVKKMLAEKNKENGLIGNIYSTGEAMQVSQRLKQETEKRVTEETISLSFLIGLPRSYYPLCFLYYL